MKKLLLLFISVPCFAAPPVITPSIPIVYVSSGMQFFADQSVTWDLMPGSTGTISAGGLYTAPGPVLAKQSYYGCAMLPQDHIFNTKISALPIDTSSTTYLHTQLTAAPVAFEVDMPDNLYSNSTSSTSMVFNYTPSANGNFKLLGFPSMRVENGIFSDKNQVDQHILGIDKDTCIASELYKLYPIGAQSDCLTCNSQSGVKYSDQYSFNLGVDAAGLPIIPLTVGYQELKNCADNGVPIAHALRITFSVGLLANAHIWPAIAHATDGGSIPFGARLRLKSSFTNSGSAAAQCIQQALKDYGAFVNDGGINMHIQLRQDVIADYSLFTAITSELPGISGFNSDNFEFVDESSLRDTDSTSPTYNTGRVTSTNTYVTPSHYAVVIASNTTTHQSSFMPLIIQPTTIGVEFPVGYSFMAGTPQTSLNVWVHGNSNTGFSCSMSPTLGTLTSGGLYTPPATSTIKSSATVTCTASADPGAVVKFPIIVYPNGAIRVRLANASNANYGPDTNGNTWYVEEGAFWRLQGYNNCDWSAETWTGVTDSGLYKQCEYVTYGSGDQLHSFTVPNGTYQIKLYFAVGGGATFTRGTWIQGIDYQGTIYSGNSSTTMTGNGPWTELGLTGKQIDVCDITGSCAGQVPGTVTLNATVTNRNLMFAIRHIAPVSVSQPGSLLNAFEITQLTSTEGLPSTGGKGGLNFKGGVRIR